MDDFISLIVLLAFVVLAMPIIALVVAIRTRSRIATLEYRIVALDGAVSGLAGEVARLRGTGPAPGAAASSVPPSVSEPAPPEGEVAAPEPAESEAEPAEADAGTAGPAASRPTDGADGAGAPLSGSVPPVAARPRRTLDEIENMIGGRWSVLLGGIATALGAILLVRATIEAGLLGPAARIALGALFAAALFGAGEWLRRRDRQLALPIFPSADVPAVLTAAGVVAAFATAYAAYALYAFLSPALAFVLLTVIGLASLLLSAVHGPGLAAIGLLAAYATPVLVSTDRPAIFALVAHVLIVTAAVLGVATLRNWLWLAMGGVAGGVAWAVVAAFLGGDSNGPAGLVLLVGLAAQFAFVFGWLRHEDRNASPQDVPFDRVALIAFAALALAALVQFAVNWRLPQPWTGLLLAAIVMAAAQRWPALAPAGLVSALVALLAVAAVDLHLAFQPGLQRIQDIAAGLVPVDTFAYLRSAVLIVFPAAALALWGVRSTAATAPRAAGWLASAAGAATLLGLVVAYLRIAPFETRPVFGAAGLLLAAGAAALCEYFGRARPGDMAAPAPAAFAVISAAALSFAMAVSLDTGWMPLAFTLAAAAIAWVYLSRPLPVIPWVALAVAVIGTASLWFSLPFGPSEVGATPILNRLLLLVGLPAIAVLGAGELLRRNGVGVAAASTTALGLALLALFVSLEIRHLFNGGRVDSRNVRLAEMGTQTLAALAFTIGLQRVARLTGAGIFSGATLVAGAISALCIAAGLLLFANPFFTDEPVGRLFLFNHLLPAYLLPALLAAIVAWQARPIRPRWYTLAFAALAGLLLFAFVSLSVRHAFRGDSLGLWHSTSDAEYWTYSAAWLVMGVAVLAIGHRLNSLPIRAASGILIALTICKVFLFDLSELTGAIRAFSFIGLGLCLLAIGRFYQRVLGVSFGPRAGGATPPGDGAAGDGATAPEAGPPPA